MLSFCLKFLKVYACNFTQNEDITNLMEETKQLSKYRTILQWYLNKGINGTLSLSTRR